MQVVVVVAAAAVILSCQTKRWKLRASTDPKKSRISSLTSQARTATLRSCWRKRPKTKSLFWTWETEEFQRVSRHLCTPSSTLTTRTTTDNLCCLIRSWQRTLSQPLNSGPVLYQQIRTTGWSLVNNSWWLLRRRSRRPWSNLSLNIASLTQSYPSITSTQSTYKDGSDSLRDRDQWVLLIINSPKSLNFPR